MKAIVGTAPNLPWWRLKNMSDKEIEEFNRGHMVEVEMSDNKSEVIARNQRERDRIWNAAIEAAMKAIEGAPLFVEAIRKLKK